MADRLQRTELHYAAADGDAARVAELLRAGADPRVVDRRGWTPLHFAAQANSVRIIELLLHAGAVVDAADEDGNTPLFRAVFNSKGTGEAISVLRAAGADPMQKNAHGVSPLSLAHTIANHDVRQFFSDLPVPEKVGGTSSMPPEPWPFDQPPNAATFTQRSIAFDGAPILHVTHDSDDHGWQFLGLEDADESDACIVALGEIVRIDASVLQLAALPPGWHAWRDSTTSPWQRSPMPHAAE